MGIRLQVVGKARFALPQSTRQRSRTAPGERCCSSCAARRMPTPSRWLALETEVETQAESLRDRGVGRVVFVNGHGIKGL